MAAQGSFLIFLTMVVLYAWLMNRWEKELRDEEAKAHPSSH
jgi:putative solute:sodium symporter small subunit